MLPVQTETHASRLAKAKLRKGKGNTISMDYDEIQGRFAQTHKNLAGLASLRGNKKHQKLGKGSQKKSGGGEQYQYMEGNDVVV